MLQLQENAWKDRMTEGCKDGQTLLNLTFPVATGIQKSTIHYLYWF